MKIVLVSYPTRLDSPPYTLPFNLMYLATWLRENGHNPVIIDGGMLRIHTDELAKLVEKENPDLIGIGGIITGFSYLKKATKAIKKLLGDIPIVIGGQIASPIPDIIFDNTECDYIVHGYGEIPLLNLANALEKGNSTDSIKGISFFKNGKVCRNSAGDFPNDLDEIPFPAYDLIDVETYIKNNEKIIGNFVNEYSKKNVNIKPISEIRAIDFLVSRGCVAKCTFCIHEFEYKGFYHNSNNYIEQHVDFLVNNYGINYLRIGEEMAFPNINIIRDFVDMMNEKFPNIYFQTASRANTFTKKYVEELERGNCLRAGFGYETGSETMLKKYRKKISSNRNVNGYKALAESRLDFKTTMMVGGVGETLETIKETCKSMREARMTLSNIGVFITNPYPGSRLYDWCLEHGLIKDEVAFLELISGVDADKMSVNMTPFPEVILRLFRAMVNGQASKNEQKYNGTIFSLKHKIKYWLVPQISLEIYFGYRRFMGLFLAKYRSDDLMHTFDEKGFIEVGYDFERKAGRSHPLMG